jgi:hypothetical protein
LGVPPLSATLAVLSNPDRGAQARSALLGIDIAFVCDPSSSLIRHAPRRSRINDRQRFSQLIYLPSPRFPDALTAIRTSAVRRHDDERCR